MCRGLDPSGNQCPADGGELQTFWEQVQARTVRVSVRAGLETEPRIGSLIPEGKS